MGYEWAPIVPGLNDDRSAYGHVTIDGPSPTTWAMLWYDDAVPPASSGGGGGGGSDDWGPSEYSYQVQVPYEYYADVETVTNFPGAIISQTFVATRSGWMAELGLFFTKIAADGDVQVLICRTNGGKPDLTRVLARTTVARADLKKFTVENPLETRFPIGPAMLNSGERYAIALITQGAHYTAMAEAGYTEGTFFTGTDGEFFQGDILKDLKFKVYMARFLSPRTEVVLQNISLAGGINDLSIRTEQPLLEGATLVYEAQIDGKWEPLQGNNLGAFSGAPDIVPLRAVFTGTADIQVGLQLGAGRVIASRPTVSSTIVSDAITVSAKRYFLVDIVVPRWDPAKNTVTAQLLTGVSYATVTASSTAVVLDESPRAGWKRLRFTFDIGSTVNSYKVKTILTRAADGMPVRRMERTSVATG